MSEKEIRYHILSKLASSKDGLYFSEIHSEEYDFLKFFRLLMDLQEKDFIERDKVSKKYLITKKGLEELKNLKKQA
jgi:predicted transcriptional regulator